MLIEIKGTLSNYIGQDTFLPTSLYFATEDCEDNKKVSDKCIKLYTVCNSLFGIDYNESQLYHNHFSFSWRDDVYLCMVNEFGDYLEFRPIVSEFLKIIRKNKMRLVNMDVYCKSNTSCTIESLILRDEYITHRFDKNLINKIELVPNGGI